MIDPDLRALVIPRSPKRGGVRMWQVDLLLDPNRHGQRHTAKWLPGDQDDHAEVYSVVINDLDLDAFPDPDLISVKHTASRTPMGHAVIWTELATPA